MNTVCRPADHVREVKVLFPRKPEFGDKAGQERTYQLCIDGTIDETAYPNWFGAWDWIAELKRAEATYALGEQLSRSLRENMDYLTNYASRPGCRFDKLKTPMGGTKVTLYADFAPLSFAFVIRHYDEATGEMKFWFNGGLIYDGPLPGDAESRCDGTFPALTGSLNRRIGWSTHT